MAGFHERCGWDKSYSTARQTLGLTVGLILELWQLLAR